MQNWKKEAIVSEASSYFRLVSSIEVKNKPETYGPGYGVTEKQI